MRYLANRALHGVVLLVGVSLLSFVLLEVAPGSFFDEMRLNPQVSPETVAALEKHYGLDRSVPERYLRWLRSVLKGEFGFSLSYNGPVGPLLWLRARNTLLLTVTATLLAWLIAVPLGVWAARNKSWGDRIFGGVTSTLLAIPDLVLALAFLLFALRSGYFPTGGMVSPRFAELSLGHKAQDLAWHLCLPVSVLALVTFPALARHVRAAMTEVLESRFIRAAQGHGIPPARLLFRHAFPAAANPLVSLFGLSIATLLSVSALIEVVMSWPGLGPLLLEAILARDLYLIVGAVMFSTVFLIAGNLLADLLLYWTDPRIRTA